MWIGIGLYPANVSDNHTKICMSVAEALVVLLGIWHSWEFDTANSYGIYINTFDTACITTLLAYKANCYTHTRSQLATFIVELVLLKQLQFCLGGRDINEQSSGRTTEMAQRRSTVWFLVALQVVDSWQQSNTEPEPQRRSCEDMQSITGSIKQQN